MRVLSPMRVLSISLLALLVAGCASEQEIAARDSARCESFGFKPGTEAFSNCRLKLYNGRYQRTNGYYGTYYYW